MCQCDYICVYLFPQYLIGKKNIISAVLVCFHTLPDQQILYLGTIFSVV